MSGAWREGQGQEGRVKVIERPTRPTRGGEVAAGHSYGRLRE
jgi:hypothetical protein